MPPTASAGAFGAPVARSPCCQRQQVLVGGLLLRLVIDPVRLVVLLDERPGGIGQRADHLHEQKTAARTLLAQMEIGLHARQSKQHT